MSAGDILIRSASMQRLPKGSDGQVLKLSSGSPSWQTGGNTTAADLADIRDQISYLMFKKDANVTYQQINGMVFDSFTDANGIDTSNCANIARNASNYYAPNIPGANIAYYPENKADGFQVVHSSLPEIGEAFTLANQATITSCRFYMNKANAPTGNVSAYLYNATGITGSNSIPTGNALCSFNTIDMSNIPNAAGLVQFNLATPYTANAGNYALTVQYTGGNAVANNLLVGVDFNTPTYAGDFVYTYNAIEIKNWLSVSLYDTCFYLLRSSATQNATLISNPFTAISTPATARCSLFVNPVDALTLNTDLLAYASSNNGTTWNQITLANVASLPGSIKQYTGSVTLTGANTAMRIKVVSANNKNFQITSWGLAWY
jgi:hypothetical protein